MDSNKVLRKLECYGVQIWSAHDFKWSELNFRKFLSGSSGLDEFC